MAAATDYFTLVTGSNKDYYFVITDPDGDPTDLSTKTVELIAYRKDTGVQYLPTKAGTKSDGVEGIENVVMFSFTAAELTEQIDLTFIVQTTDPELLVNGEISVVTPANYYGSYWQRTIDFDYKLCLKISNKEQRGNLDPETFNIFAKAASDAYVYKRLRFWPSDQKIMDELVHQVCEVDLDIANGFATRPGNYLQIDSLSRTYNGSRQTIDVLPHDKFDNRESSVVAPPAEEYPIAKMTGSRIHILPTTITEAQLSYLRRPQTPKWNYSLDGNGNPVYSAIGSKDFEFPDDCHNELCAHVLKMLGVNIASELLVAYATAESQMQTA